MLLEIDLRDAVEPELAPRVDEHRDLDAVAARKRERPQELPARRDLAGERLAHVRELGVEEGERRARSEPVHAPAFPFSAGGGALAKGPAVEGLHERHTLLAHERAKQPGDEIPREVLGVGVEVADQVAAQHRERAPHRIALAQHGAAGAHQRRLLVHLGSGARGELARTIGRGRVDHGELIDDAGAL